MPFNLDDLNPATRFYWEDNEEEWVEFRLASDEDTEQMRKKAGIKYKTEYRRDRGRLQRLDNMDFNEKKMEKFNGLVNSHSIVDWYLVDNNGIAIPCTDENKNRLMKGSPLFSNWVANCLEKMRDDVEFQKEREEKNLSST